jgi:hypothetical protein
VIKLIESVTRAERLLLLLVTAVLLPAAQALGDERYTVFMELEPPYAANRAALQKLLKREGHGAYPEGDREAALVLTAAQLKALFGARVVVRKVAASARPGMVEQPYLESAVIPPRLARYIRRVYLDPQRG